jgi:hypothetical protein
MLLVHQESDGRRRLRLVLMIHQLPDRLQHHANVTLMLGIAAVEPPPTRVIRLACGRTCMEIDEIAVGIEHRFTQ